MKYTCIIVDDEPISHDVLKVHLEQIPEITLQYSFFNAKDAGDYLAQHTVDILLLDIQMPEINGLDFLRSLHEKPISIITTAFRDYALEGFELGVIDYLLKPIDFERFQLAIKRATDFLNLVKREDALSFEKEKDHYNILIKTGTRKVLLDYRTIQFAQGLKDYTILHTETKKYVVKGSIKSLEEYLPHDYFIRIHKSFIVATPLVKVIRRNKIELESVSIPIGRNYKARLNELFNSGKP